MSSSIRRGTLAATALVLAAATLSACAAGRDAQTLEVKPDNAATSVGDVKIQNVNIITTDDGPSAVTARIFNEGTKAETLTSVTVKGAGARVKLSPAKGEKALTVPAGGSLALGGRGNASAVLPESGSTAVKDGNAQPITFDLSRTGAVSLRATVVPEHGDYKKFGPTVAPSPSAPSGSPSASPSGSPSASPSEDASGSASPEEGDAENGEEIEEESASGDHAAGH
ncbi:DUF461 domain-containing protein [Streptomyces albidus (ex Kaewkla and Franco 2022)]|uniref:DUF461 domain-containing protein n=1 Tax=Streptomyces albidus (ex Kaewkla and Franco 2022) TaxID=722709 RepID=UPI0015EF34BC|nr:DUF461 domain-containing protein [Streptomyces albidus (ex Kaewkla and Franco 2022)]